MTISIEDKLILYCVSQHNQIHQKETSLLLDNPINWEYVIEQANANHVLPLIHEALRQEDIPDEIKQQFQQNYLSTTQHNMRLAAETIRIIKLLAQQSVKAIPYKGPIQSLITYNDLSKRPGSDIDLLVRTADFKHAKQLLNQEGYQVQTDYEDAMQNSFFHPIKGIAIDLHYGIPPARLKFNTTVLWENLLQLDCLGKKVHTFNKTDTILITAINASKEYWQPSLHHFSDIKTLTIDFKEDDWKRLLTRAKALHCERILLCSLSLTSTTLGVELPKFILDKLTALPAINRAAKEINNNLFFDQRTFDEEIAMNTIHFKSTDAFFITLTDSAWQRLCMKTKSLTKPTKQDYELIKLPQALHSFYFLVKAIRIVLRTTKR